MMDDTAAMVIGNNLVLSGDPANDAGADPLPGRALLRKHPKIERASLMAEQMYALLDQISLTLEEGLEGVMKTFDGTEYLRFLIMAQFIGRFSFTSWLAIANSSTDMTPMP